jgi:hypothetical protein
MAAFSDNRTAGREVGLGKREVFTGSVTGGAHGFASSRRALRSGRKMSGTLPSKRSLRETIGTIPRVLRQRTGSIK